MTTIDISPESGEQLAHHDDIGGDALRFAPTLRALSASLTQSRAETAAAYERAAVTLDKEAASLRADASRFRGGTDPHHDRMNFASAAIKQASAIRALATPEQTFALDAVRAEAREQGMREAAVICRNVGFKDHPDSVAYGAEFQILAAITKGDKA